MRSGARWPEPRFRPAGGEVIDRLTGLAWATAANHADGPLFWEEALAWVAEMNQQRALGRNDWRMPTRRELRSLASFEHAVPSLPRPHPFVGVEPTWYWSATSAAVDHGYAWALELLGGRMFYLEKQRSALLWPCRGRSEVLPVTGQRGAFDHTGRAVPLCGSGQDGDGDHGIEWPNPRFRPRGGTVLDRLTELVWLRRADAAEELKSWSGALAAVCAMNQRGAAGRCDWRLPTIAELDSLVDASQCRPALQAGHPFTSVGESYWSSTTSAYETDWAMVLHLDRGAIGVGPKSSVAFSVWPVAGR